MISNIAWLHQPPSPSDGLSYPRVTLGPFFSLLERAKNKTKQNKKQTNKQKKNLGGCNNPPWLDEG